MWIRIAASQGPTLGLWSVLVVSLVAFATSAPAFGQAPSPDAPAPEEPPPAEQPAPEAAQPEDAPAADEPAALDAEPAAVPEVGAELEAGAPAAPAANDAGDIVVTGTRIRVKSAFTASAPVQIVDRKQLELTGATNLSDVVQNLTVAQGSGFQGEGQQSRQGRIGVTGVDLRGLGFGATLVLVNGRRLPISGGTAPGGGGATADLGQIPLAAVDRVEVLTGGASAIYGSDAVAGVVNVITRKNWEGLRVGLEGQTADRLDYKGYNVNAAYGAIGQRARMTTALSWDLHNELKTNERDWTKMGQLEIPAGFPGTFLVGATTMPDVACNTASSRSRVVTMAGQTGPSMLCAFSDRDFEVLVPAVQRGSVFASAEYDLTDHTTAFIEGNFSRMRGDSVLWPFMVLPPFSLTVPADHVDNPYGQDVRFFGRVTDESSRLGAEDDTLRMVAGLKGDLEGAASETMFEDWEWEVGLSLGVSRYRSSLTDTIRPALEDALNSCSNPADLSGCFNPFFSSRDGTGTANSDEVMRRIRGLSTSVTDSGRRSYDAGMTGSLFELPGGNVGLAFGGEVRHEWRQSDADIIANNFDYGLTIGNTDYVATRNVYGGYLELRWPLVDGIELQTAGRVDYYTDIEKTALNPTVGITISPADISGRDNAAPAFRRLQIRGHASTAFRAPEVLDASRNSVVIPTQMQIGSGLPSFIPVRTSGNPNLDNEQALALSGGVVWTVMDELSFLGDFWYFRYKDRIGAEDPGQKAAAWQAAMAAQGGACVLDSPGVIVSPDTCGVREIDVSQVNTRGTTLTDGIDFATTISLTGKTFGGSTEDWGTLSFGAQGTYTLGYDIPRNSVLPAVIEQGIVECDGTGPEAPCSVVGKRNSNNFAPPIARFRANFPLSWAFNGHVASFFGHYMSPLEDDNDSAHPGDFSGDISAIFTMDLQYAYTITDWIGKALTMRVGVTNLLDQDPPAVTSERWGYEPLLHDPRGRVLYAKLISDF